MRDMGDSNNLSVRKGQTDLSIVLEERQFQTGWRHEQCRQCSSEAVLALLDMFK